MNLPVEWFNSLQAGLFADLKKKNLSEILSECKTAWIQIIADVMGPNCMQRFSESEERVMVCDCGISWLRGFKTFSMLNSAEHEIYHAHK